MAFTKDHSKHTPYGEVIRQIRGVVAAKVITDSAGEILEIHVLAGPERGPKLIVRDIESVFVVNYGINIDHKKISIAQLRDGETESLGYGLSSTGEVNIRPRIASVTTLSAERKTEVKVLLDIGGNHYEGSSAGPGTSGNRLRLVSQATLMALENCFEGGNLLTEDVSVISISGCQAVISSVSIMTDAGEERLIGAAFINSDEREAVVKATLAAVNRRLEQLFNN